MLHLPSSRARQQPPSFAPNFACALTLQRDGRVFTKHKRNHFLLSVFFNSLISRKTITLHCTALGQAVVKLKMAGTPQSLMEQMADMRRQMAEMEKRIGESQIEGNQRALLVAGDRGVVSIVTARSFKRSLISYRIIPSPARLKIGVEHDPIRLAMSRHFHPRQHQLKHLTTLS